MSSGFGVKNVTIRRDLELRAIAGAIVFDHIVIVWLEVQGLYVW
jgi:hypothetical protein